MRTTRSKCPASDHCESACIRVLSIQLGRQGAIRGPAQCLRHSLQVDSHGPARRAPRSSAAHTAHQRAYAHPLSSSLLILRRHCGSWLMTSSGLLVRRAHYSPATTAAAAVTSLGAGSGTAVSAGRSATGADDVSAAAATTGGSGGAGGGAGAAAAALEGAGSPPAGSQSRAAGGAGAAAGREAVGLAAGAGGAVAAGSAVTAAAAAAAAGIDGVRDISSATGLLTGSIRGGFTAKTRTSGWSRL